MGSRNNSQQNSEDFQKSPPPISSTFGSNIDHTFPAVDASENGMDERINNNNLLTSFPPPPPPPPPLSPLNYSYNSNEQQQQQLYFFRQQQQNEERFDQIDRRLENIER